MNARRTIDELVEGARKARLRHAAALAARKHARLLSLRRLASLHDDSIQFVAGAVVSVSDALQGFEDDRDRCAAAALLDLAFDGCCAVADTGRDAGLDARRGLTDEAARSAEGRPARPSLFPAAG